VIELTVSADAAGQRLDKYVRRALRDVPLSHVYKMFRTRKIRVNGLRGRAEQLLADGDKIAIRGDEERLLVPAEGTVKGPRAARRTFGILHEDEHLLVVDKPAGLAAHPGSGIEGATLVDEVRAHLRVPADLPPGSLRESDLPPETLAGLTDAQKGDIRAVFEAAKPEAEALHAAFEADRAAMKAALEKTPPDPCEVGAAALKLKGDREARRALLEKVRTGVLAVLTPAQQAKLAGCLEAPKDVPPPGESSEPEE